MTQTCLLVGYYGQGNAGDEMLLLKTKALLHQHVPHATLWIREGGSAYLESDPSTRCSIWRAVFKSQKVILGGGGLLQDASSRRSLWFYSLVIALAKWGQKDILGIGQGLGPYHHWSSKWVMRRVLPYIQHFSVRDERSKAWTTQLAPKSTVVLGSDLSFYQETPHMTGTYDPAAPIGVVMTFSGHTAKYTHALSQHLQATQSPPFYLCFDPADTPPQNNARKDKVPIDMNAYFPTQTPLPHKLSCVISMRYHACVWAALHGIPFIALVKDDKLKAIAQTFGQEWIQIPNAKEWPGKEASSLQAVVDTLNKVQNNRETYRQALMTQCSSCIDQAQHHDEVFSL